MSRKSNEENYQPDFKARYAEFSDAEILNILKKRKHYQPEAVNVAIEEAILRGLIHSEQDLFSEEFREEQLKSSIFPNIENETARAKTRKSIARSLLIIGVVPTIWGGINFYRTEKFENIALLLLGALWIFASFQLMKKPGKQTLNLMFLMLIAAFAYFIKLLTSLVGITFFDVFFAIITGLLILYGLLFYRKLS